MYTVLDLPFRGAILGFSTSFCVFQMLRSFASNYLRLFCHVMFWYSLQTFFSNWLCLFSAFFFFRDGFLHVFFCVYDPIRRWRFVFCSVFLVLPEKVSRISRFFCHCFSACMLGVPLKCNNRFNFLCRNAICNNSTWRHLKNYINYWSISKYYQKH